MLTSLAGRSADTGGAGKAAGMVAASDEEIAAGDFILSILPPGDALSLAERFVPTLTASNAKPVYVDCNAINPKTVERVAAAIAPTGCAFVDAGIIGPPPKPAAGRQAPGIALLCLGSRGVALCGRCATSASTSACSTAPISAASALKMSYAGITKGTQAIGAAMMLAALRAGSADDLFAELQMSQKEMLGWFKRQLGAPCRRRPIAGSRKCTRSPASSATIRRRANFTRAPRSSSSGSPRISPG